MAQDLVTVTAVNTTELEVVSADTGDRIWDVQITGPEGATKNTGRGETVSFDLPTLGEFEFDITVDPDDEYKRFHSVTKVIDTTKSNPTTVEIPEKENISTFTEVINHGIIQR